MDILIDADQIAKFANRTVGSQTEQQARDYLARAYESWQVQVPDKFERAIIEAVEMLVEAAFGQSEAEARAEVYADSMAGAGGY